MPATPGRALLVVRARDAADNVQPTSVPYNHYGYEMNAVETADIQIQPGRTTLEHSRRRLEARTALGQG